LLTSYGSKLIKHAFLKRARRQIFWWLVFHCRDRNRNRRNISM
jgi:hypothetical protein